MPTDINKALDLVRELAPLLWCLDPARVGVHLAVGGLDPEGNAADTSGYITATPTADVGEGAQRQTLPIGDLSDREYPSSTFDSIGIDIGDALDAMLYTLRMRAEELRDALTAVILKLPQDVRKEVP